MKEIEDRTIFVAATISGKTVHILNRLKYFGEECWERITKQLCGHYDIYLASEVGNPTLGKLAARIFLAVDAKREASKEKLPLTTPLQEIQAFILQVIRDITTYGDITIMHPCKSIGLVAWKEIEVIVNHHYGLKKRVRFNVDDQGAYEDTTLENFSLALHT